MLDALRPAGLCRAILNGSFSDDRVLVEDGVVGCRTNLVSPGAW